MPSGVVKAQPKHTQGAAQGVDDDEEEEPVLVSGSYNWVLTTVSFFIKEVWVLVRGDRSSHLLASTDGEVSALADIETAQDHEDKGSVKEKAPPSYTRANLCEVRTFSPISPSLPLFSFLFLSFFLFIYFFPSVKREHCYGISY